MIYTHFKLPIIVLKCLSDDSLLHDGHDSNVCGLGELKYEF